jgi:hypothetical protein
MISLRAMMIHLKKSYYYMDQIKQIEQFLRHNMVAYVQIEKENLQTMTLCIYSKIATLQV